MVARRLLLTLGLVCAAGPALAWVYPEHRDISVLAVETLDPERRAEFDGLWSEARVGHEKRLCERGADTAQGVAPDCIDWAAMSAIAGDHSCSSKQLLNTVTDSEWILTVADVAAQLKVDLSHVSKAAPVEPSKDGAAAQLSYWRRQFESQAARAQRINALRIADVRLQRADPEYATRAGSNNAHFLTARATPDVTSREYLESTLRTGTEINAVGVFGWYHLSAMQKATRLAQETLTPEERSALTRAMLADEAFALHFLEDIFAAGHVAGTWGDVAQRKGTHDYYNESGLEVSTWDGGAKTTVLTGDAHMRPEDAERAAESVRLSLEQLLDIAAGRDRKTNLAYEPKAPLQPEALDVCKNDRTPPRPEGRATPQAIELGVEVLAHTPVPSLGYGLGSMPRFRAEIGPFIGAAGSLDGRYVDGGFTGLESGSGLIGGAELALRFGYGLEGVLGTESDGLVFFSVGFKGDTPSTNKFSTASVVQEGGSHTAAIPSRTSLTARLRMPFYLIPGDLLLLSPLYFVSPDTYQNIAVTAANGGLIPWQLGWETRFGRFQFVLGREVGVTFFGALSDDTLLAPGATPGVPTVISFKSTSFDFPILEYRPYRAFDMTQTSQLIIQLYGGMDDPHGASVVFPAGAPGINMDRVYSIGVRLVFDWRRYF